MLSAALTTVIHTLSLHDALPISIGLRFAGDLPGKNPGGEAGRLPRLLSDQHSHSVATVDSPESDRSQNNFGSKHEWRQRRRSKSRTGLSFFRMQRKRAALRRSETP